MIKATIDLLDDVTKGNKKGYIRNSYLVFHGWRLKKGDDGYMTIEMLYKDGTALATCTLHDVDFNIGDTLSFYINAGLMKVKIT